jgi:signal transduction histidine kinase
MNSRRRTIVRAARFKPERGDDFAVALEKAKLRALYNFAYGLSHEINNPLANIATRAQTLLADERDPDRKKKLSTIVQQAFRAHEMIADLMLFARPPALQLEHTNLSQIARTVIAEMQPQAAEQQTRLVQSGDGRIQATVDPVQIAVALKALLQNSLEALRTGGNIEVVVGPEAQWRSQAAAFKSNGRSHRPFKSAPGWKRSKTKEPKLVCLSVIDDGPGIPVEFLPQIFDPFFCGREAGRGLGLGLSKAWRIVDLHGGQIHVARRPQSGMAFTLILPTQPRALAPRNRPRK